MLVLCSNGCSTEEGQESQQPKGIRLSEGTVLETERLKLRELNQDDFHSLCKILQDETTMYAYEGAFSDQEVQEWLNRQLSRYQKWRFGQIGRAHV